MRSLDKFIKVGHLILLYESLIAGLFFITVAIAVFVNPAMATTVLKFGFLSEARGILSRVMPADNLVAIVMASSLLMGITNLSLAWAAVYVRIDSRKTSQARQACLATYRD